MTRLAAAVAILICLTFSISSPVYSQSNPGTDDRCFPWQEFKGGQCVAKPSQAPPPLPAPAASDAPSTVAPPAPPAPPGPPVPAGPCPVGSFKNAAGQCSCPSDMHAEADGRCVADRVIRPADNFACDGGTVNNGACVCPSGFRLMGGTCVRSDADNCMGGEMTVSGKCLCNGQVTMSGETYLLEYSNGKCLPMRCPITAMKDGTCGPSLAAEPSTVQENKDKPTPRQARDKSDEEPHRRHCGRGMVSTRAGCLPAHRRLPDIYRQYYRDYPFPGAASPY